MFPFVSMIFGLDVFDFDSRFSALVFWNHRGINLIYLLSSLFLEYRLLKRLDFEELKFTLYFLGYEVKSRSNLHEVLFILLIVCFVDLFIYPFCRARPLR